MIDYHVADAATPFSISITVMKHLGANLNNLNDKLYFRNALVNNKIKLKGHNNELTYLITMKLGNPFLIWNKKLFLFQVIYLQL